MTAGWTTERVLALAPDPESAKAGKSLSNVAKWSNLGANDQAVWGECKGSGSKPYQTRIELATPAFKCSCPSRKFPCKHSLGLFFLFISEQPLFTNDVVPGWVSDWLASREERTQKKAARTAVESTPDPVAREKREAQRNERVQAGLDELEQWIRDLIRTGLASLPQRPGSYWERMAARMVDAQVPGLASRIRACSSIVSTSSDWPDRLLRFLGETQLIMDAWRRRESLPPSLTDDLKSVLGFQVRKEDVLASDAIEDTWFVLGQTIDEDMEGLRIQKTWMLGVNSEHHALLLDFAHRSQTLESVATPGMMITGKVAFYPSGVPLRALIAGATNIASSNSFPTGASMDSELKRWRSSVALSPWIMEQPMLLQDVRLTRSADNGSWSLADSSGQQIKVQDSGIRLWQALAVTSSSAGTFFGIWNGNELTILSVNFNNTFTDLSPTRTIP